MEVTSIAVVLHCLAENIQTWCLDFVQKAAGLNDFIFFGVGV